MLVDMVGGGCWFGCFCEVVSGGVSGVWVGGDGWVLVI